ncbi:MAG: PqqD family protein [Acidimicrobiales bacterium]|jgi:hypothetical protein
MRARSEQVMWREIDGQVVILDLRSSSYLRSNGTGARLWERLQTECQHDDLVDVLVSSYQVDPEVAASDVDAFLATLREGDLLER